MNQYLDIITRNHKLGEFSDSDSSNPESFRDSLIAQTGGNSKKKEDIITHTPTGSFPPIYKINKEEYEKEKYESKERGFAQVKTALSIKEIMTNRRDTNSQAFISL